GTKLARREGYWQLGLYREAAEGIAVFHSAAHQGRACGESDPEAAARVALRRAKTRMRRYCATNRLNRLATLTYRGAGCHDPLELREDVAEFFKHLRRGLGGDPFPYLWTSEWHKT